MRMVAYWYGMGGMVLDGLLVRPVIEINDMNRVWQV